MVYIIKAQNLSKAWLQAVKCILKNGMSIGELKKEIIDLIVEIKNPLQVDREIEDIVTKYIGSKWIKKGANSIFPENTENIFASAWYKTYWSRLRRYRNRVDQLGTIINRLKEKPKSKQLFSITFDPLLDIQPRRPFNPSMPCLTALDFKFRDDKLCLFALFRSHDFGRKAYGNYIGLGRLLNFVCEKTGFHLGKLVVYSRSAHVRSKEFKAISNIVSHISQNY